MSYTTTITPNMNSINDCKCVTMSDYFNFIYCFTFLFYILGSSLISITSRYNYIQNKIHLLANNKKIGKYIAEYIYSDTEDFSNIEEISDDTDYSEDDDDNDDLDVDPCKNNDKHTSFENDTKIKTPSYVFDNMFY